MPLELTLEDLKVLENVVITRLSNPDSNIRYWENPRPDAQKTGEILNIDARLSSGDYSGKVTFDLVRGDTGAKVENITLG